MLLHRVTDHVRSQNWFAVGVDFFIVVIGVFIGIQVANWNDERLAREKEQMIIGRLTQEFVDHREALETLAGNLLTYRESARKVVAAVKAGKAPDDSAALDRWVEDMSNLGRPPARSETYIQLVSSGEFDLLSNEDLQTLLVRFDQEIERNRFIYEEGAALLFGAQDLMAAADANFVSAGGDAAADLRFQNVDFSKLGESQGALQWICFLHLNNHKAAIRLIEICDDILSMLAIDQQL